MDVARLQDHLRERAFLHDDPDAYLAGVEDAVSVLAADQVEPEAGSPETRVESA